MADVDLEALSGVSPDRIDLRSAGSGELRMRIGPTEDSVVVVLDRAAFDGDGATIAHIDDSSRLFTADGSVDEDYLAASFGIG